MTNFSWVWESWRVHFPAPWLDTVLAFAAILCGLLVGGERQRREKPAGLRTLALVCLGSATFTMASFAFTTTTGDSGRVAAQIVTGIGFLGAGVILHGQRVISGMTTAAVIWVTAAIGMVVGSGYVFAGLGLSILVNRLMVGIFLYETRWNPELRHVCVTIEYGPNRGLTQVRLERVLIDYELSGARAEWLETSPEQGRLTLHMSLARVHLYELLAEMAEVPDIYSIVREDTKPVRSSS